MPQSISSKYTALITTSLNPPLQFTLHRFEFLLVDHRMGWPNILTAFVVSLGLISVRANDHTNTKVVTSPLNEEVEVKENFRNLFDSLTKNDFRRREEYRNILEDEAAKERKAFHSMKEIFRFARHTNVQKQKNFHAAPFKRETHENSTVTGLETTALSETTEAQKTNEQANTTNPGKTKKKAETNTTRVSPGMPTSKWTRLRFTAMTRITPEFEATTVKRKIHPKFERQQLLDFLPKENNEDPYTPALFYNFTGMDAIRVSRRSRDKIHNAIKKHEFRAFIREMDVYARRVPFKQLTPKAEDNKDGLYFRVAFYMVLRAMNFTPTPYFNQLWQEHKTIAVETDPTVFLFAVNTGLNVDYDFNVTWNIVEGPSGLVLPRDYKTIVCAGIHFDTEFDPKIQHWRAVQRDKTLIVKKKDEKKKKKDKSSESESSDEEE